MVIERTLSSRPTIDVVYVDIVVLVIVIVVLAILFIFRLLLLASTTTTEVLMVVGRAVTEATTVEVER
jgi:hypothetical protein